MPTMMESAPKAASIWGMERDAGRYCTASPRHGHAARQRFLGLRGQRSGRTNHFPQARRPPARQSTILLT